MVTFLGPFSFAGVAPACAAPDEHASTTARIKILRIMPPLFRDADKFCARVPGVYQVANKPGSLQTAIVPCPKKKLNGASPVKVFCA
jgi:hypothetical protein